MVSATASWHAIGIGLGVGPGILAQIEGKKPIDCMIVVLTNWLKKNYNVVRFGEPTWRIVVKVVANPAAGNDFALASHIAGKHPGRFDFQIADIILCTFVRLHNCTHHSLPVYNDTCAS